MSSLLCSRRNNKIDGDGEPQIISSTSPAATMKKGPWTDEEDEQLVRFVRLFGERRWDFLAKVSGLRRTGKSCRLRWVNYLHPGLRRGRITEDEERRIVELHAQWGSRWSRIARSMPGRTDNEIKNFWRTRTRKKALEERRAAAGAGAGAAATATATATAEPASSSSLSSSTVTSECRLESPNSGAATASSSSGASSLLQEDGDGDAELEEASTGTAAAAATEHEQPQPQEYYGSSMDQLWSEIAAADAAAMSSLVSDACWGGAAGHYYYGAAAEPPPASPPWEYCGSDFSLWRIDDQEYYKKMLDS